MNKQPEKVQTDLSKKSTKEEISQKTNEEMKEIFDNELKISSADYIINKVKELNPDAEIKGDADRLVLFSSVPIERLNLPEGFYYNQKNGITNKHNTQSGIYGSVHVFPMKYYDPSLF